MYWDFPRASMPYNVSIADLSIRSCESSFIKSFDSSVNGFPMVDLLYKAYCRHAVLKIHVLDVESQQCSQSCTVSQTHKASMYCLAQTSSILWKPQDFMSVQLLYQRPELLQWSTMTKCRSPSFTASRDWYLVLSPEILYLSVIWKSWPASNILI